MNFTKYLFIIALASVCLISCKEEKKEEIIIVKTETPSQEKPKQTIAMEALNSKSTVKWGGTEMDINIDRSADSTLAKIKEEGIDGDTYYDNRIKLAIKRADGSEFFSQVFTKERFKEFVEKKQLKNFSLLTIIFNEATASSLDFIVGVGEPNENSDNYVNVLMSINKQGGISMKSFAIDETANQDEEMLEP